MNSSQFPSDRHPIYEESLVVVDVVVIGDEQEKEEDYNNLFPGRWLN